MRFALLLPLLAMWIEASSRPVRQPPASPVPLSPAESRLVEAVNGYRARHELPPLVVDPVLQRVARERAPFFTHCPRGLGWAWDHARRAGYRGFATDNLAQGDLRPEEAVGGWARSDGHARQMRGLRKLNGQWLDFGARRIGVGIRGRTYVAVFGAEPVAASGERRVTSGE